ncbi:MULTISPECIES: DUF4124 domain-containing protein [Colwellia]|uniref:DUF4124 domain-containing protein n=1 Tax=Colwellia marinimaniae TaxID=1513592 RepID=A0ABQ0MQU5_9GAMM|nr:MULTISPECIES: DUF4124 domain-containing protein [Colwellia]GAW94742.1 hypothetical protein MTCD1_00339 [Colwellia marinimaniae]
MLRLLGTILLLAASTLSFNLSAEIYTWTDKYGKVHFSDKPIDGEKVTTVTPKENHNIADVVSKDSQWQQDYNKTKQAKAERAQKEATLAKKNKGYCKQLKSQLAIISQGGRIYMMSPDGQRSFKSEAQLTAQKKKLNKTIKKTCR